MDAITPMEVTKTLREPAPAAMAYLLDADSEGVVRRCFIDLGFVDGLVARGSIETAMVELARRGWPHFLVVDVSGLDDPALRISQLSEVCDPETEVIVVGDRNDIVLYRDLKSAGVAEYFFKPLVGSIFNRAFTEITTGTRAVPPSRTGRLVYVLGTRGGVGATTVATNMAWYLAEIRHRRVLLLDLDLQCGDAALQFDAQPSHALREALDDPTRIDELFLERGVASVTARLDMLAGLEPLGDQATPQELAITELLAKLLPHYRYVLVDLPVELALSLPALLHMPSTLLLVSDGTIASARDVARWREKLGADTPDRALLHILNKKDAPGALPEKELLRLIPPPEVSIPWDREMMTAAVLGTKSVQKCAAMREGLSTLSRQLSGGAVDAPRSLWRRVFG